MKDAHGHQLTGCNAEALALLERGLTQLRCLRNDPLASADAALAASPELVMGHVLRAWLYLMSSEGGAVPEARAALERARALPHNDREARHLQAVGQWVDGHWLLAGRSLEDLSVEYPHDLLALQVGHQLDFFTGDARMLRDRIARVLPAWSADVPGYHALLGMYAFGLEECGDYRLAERLGRQAISREPADAWAQHAVAHVLEMQGRREEGIAWMRGNPAWQQDNMLAVHNWWHLALYHLELGDSASVLELFDNSIDASGSQIALELVDASALLWRLQLRGVDPGERWQNLAERWALLADDGHYAFNDLHACMAFASAGRSDLLERVQRAQACALQRDDDNTRMTREIGAPAIEALLAYHDGRYARCVELLRAIRNQAHGFGGSHAQRDLLDQTLLVAARRDGQAGLATALERERHLLAGQRAVH
ncbi:tetratricopeptide repeat protein [Metapseudomonas boanensis]|uniref:Tetratricopeptide repeat protein 38 n=1 Tax=Metapseudomonas boanensis TaxID=2822138 RepID=A0ABS5XK95_9GAMM|nr:tetratricopeptide repeat protein [Pseudomonas boanensis]MBT8768060.1 tetratricopeptide repeat protein [Pseudomonas boanensis]